MKNIKIEFLSSVLTLIVCCVMFLGNTYAWFTDSVTSGQNIIVAGTWGKEESEDEETEAANEEESEEDSELDKEEDSDKEDIDDLENVTDTEGTEESEDEEINEEEVETEEETDFDEEETTEEPLESSGDNIGDTNKN
jgi:predicted ribosomally synthesized peptide with SipW-like signal peptide